MDGELDLWLLRQSGLSWLKKYSTGNWRMPVNWSTLLELWKCWPAGLVTAGNKERESATAGNSLATRGAEARKIICQLLTCEVWAWHRMCGAQLLSPHPFKDGNILMKVRCWQMCYFRTSWVVAWCRDLERTASCLSAVGLVHNKY